MAATVSQGRKRRRRQLIVAGGGDGTSSPSPERFPRVATAPANLAPSSTPASTKRTATPATTVRPSSPSFGDTSELDAQISTLALIRAYGYGAVPGTPLRRRNEAPASAGEQRCHTAVHGARNLLKWSGTEGSSITGNDTPAVVEKVRRGEQSAKTRGKPCSTKPNRQPWMGPLDSRVSLTQSRSPERPHLPVVNLPTH